MSGATVQSTESVSDNLGLNNSIWYLYTAPSEGVFTFTTLGSEFDTVLRAFSSADNTLQSAVNYKVGDDIGIDPRSELSVRLLADEKVWIQLSSKYGAIGRTQLDWRNINITSEKWLGDNFVSAIALDTSKESASVSNYGASKETGEPLHAGISNAGSVWFSYTPTETGEFIFDTNGSAIDTVMALYEGTLLATLNSLAFNDDSTTTASRFKVNLEANTQYFIALASKDGGEGDVQLNYKVNNLNDDFAKLLTISGTSGSFNADFTDASLESNELDYQIILASEQSPAKLLASFTEITNGTSIDTSEIESLVNTIYQSTLSSLNDSPISKTLWWQYTPAVDAELVIDTDATNIDTALFVFTGDTLTSLNSVKYNDNIEGKLTSKVRLAVVAGTNYKIVVASRDVGNVKVNWSLVLPASQVVNNDSPAEAVSLNSDFTTSTVYSIKENNTYAKGNDNATDNIKKLVTNQSDKRLWWKLSSSTQGYFDLNTDGSSVDTFVEVYEKSTVGKLFISAFNNDYVNNSGASRITFVAKANTEYLVSVDSLNNEEGDVVLNYSFSTSSSNLLANDLFASATVLSGNNININFDNSYSRNQLGEPAIAQFEKPNSIWFKWQAPANGSVQLTAESNDVDTILAMYQGSTQSTLSLIKYNNDAAGLTGTNSKLVTVVAKDAYYYIAVASDKGVQGAINMKLDLTELTTLTSTNTNIDSSEIWDNQISSINSSLAHIVPALVTGSDLVLGVETQASSRWFTWSAPSDGLYRFDSIGSEINPALEIYQGDAINAIVLVDIDADSVSSASTVNVNANSGQTFYIRISSSYRRQGDVTLNVNRTGDINVPSTNQITGTFAEAPVALTEAGTKTWLWQSTKTAELFVTMSHASKTNQSIKVTEINGGTRTLVAELPEAILPSSVDQTAMVQSFTNLFKFAAEIDKTYEIELSSNEALLGDAIIKLNYGLEPIEQVSEANIQSTTTNIKALLPQVLQNRVSRQLDARIINSEIVPLVNSILSTNFNADEVDIKIDVVSENEEAGVIEAKLVRITVVSLQDRTVLMSIVVDPNASQDQVKHAQLNLNSIAANVITFDGNKVVSLQVDPSTFKKSVSQAFVSTRKKAVSDFPNRIITPQFQSVEVYEFELNLYDNENLAYDLTTDDVISTVVVKMPIDSQALIAWLADDSLSIIEANAKIKEALEQGVLEILSADTVEDLLMNKSEKLSTGISAIVDLDKGFIEFETSHFSAFILNAKQDASTIGQSDVAEAVSNNGLFGGCTLGGDKAVFDPTFFILLLVAFIGLNRRRLFIK